MILIHSPKKARELAINALAFEFECFWWLSIVSSMVFQVARSRVNLTVNIWLFCRSSANSS